MMIGGRDANHNFAAGNFIYDCLSNRWSSIDASVNLTVARFEHTATVLDDRTIVVASGRDVRIATPYLLWSLLTVTI